MPASCSVHRESNSISSRCFALILKWNWHFGQTYRLASRSLRKTIVPQDSHLAHRPSVRTRRSSGGVAASIDFLSLLNQAIENGRTFSVSNCRGGDCPALRFASYSNFAELIINPPLSQYTLGVR